MIRIDASFHEIQGEGLDFWKRDLYEGAVKSEFSGELYPGRTFFSGGALVIFLEVFFCNMAMIFSCPP